MHIQPTLYFQGVCDDAIDYYTRTLGAQLLFRHEFGGNTRPQYVKPGTEHKVMRAGLRIGTTTLYVSDGHCIGKPAFQGLSLSLAAASREEAHQYLDALGAEGAIQIPLQETTWTAYFGTVVDRFGLHWTVEAP
jgi:PhnB protein